MIVMECHKATFVEFVMLLFISKVRLVISKDKSIKVEMLLF